MSGQLVGASVCASRAFCPISGNSWDVLHPDFVPDSSLVGKSARRLFETLNPRYRMGDDPSLGTLAIYDWEVSKDTGLDLDTVRGGLRALNGVTLQVQTVNAECRITGLLKG
jgi:hypothetical protein